MATTNRISYSKEMSIHWAIQNYFTENASSIGTTEASIFKQIYEVLSKTYGLESRTYKKRYSTTVYLALNENVLVYSVDGGPPEIQGLRMKRGWLSDSLYLLLVKLLNLQHTNNSDILVVIDDIDGTDTQKAVEELQSFNKDGKDEFIYPILEENGINLQLIATFGVTNRVIQQLRTALFAVTEFNPDYF